MPKFNKIKPINAQTIHEEDREVFPTIKLSEKELPELKDWKTGEDYILVVKVTQDKKIELPNETKAVFSLKAVRAGADKENSKHAIKEKIAAKNS